MSIHFIRHCNQCNKEIPATWHNTFIQESANGTFRLVRRIEQDARDAVDICGPACAIAALSEWMERNAV